MKLKDNKSLYTLLVILVAIVLIFIVMCLIYISTLNDAVGEETDRYLSEVSYHIATLLNYRVRAHYANLETIASTYVQYIDEDEYQEYLMDKANESGYIRLSMVGTNYIGYSSDGLTVNYSGNTSVLNALNGKRGIESISRGHGESDIMLFAVPVVDDGVVVGVLIGTSTKNDLILSLMVESSSGELYSQIIDSDGDFIVVSTNKNAISGYINFFDAIEENGTVSPGDNIHKMQEDVLDGKAGILHYSMKDNGVNKAMSYSPLGIEDWYLLTVIPTDAAGMQKAIFIRSAVIINIVIIGLLLLLILIVMLLQKQNQNRLEKIAFIDPVTKGFNKARFDAEAGIRLEGAKKREYVAVALDIQRFKLINDSFGTKAGDETLKHVYDTIGRNLKANEIVGRITADTFYVLMNYESTSTVTSRIEKIAQDINAFNETMEQKYYLPIMAGVYIIDDPKLNLITIQDRANSARKSNKEMRQAQLCSIVFYSEMQRLRMVREREITNRMESALTNDEFIFYLQPQVELENERIVGAEALVRWADPQRGVVYPNEFIPTLEKNGFITKLDIHIFEKVCKLIEKWIGEGRDPVPVSVNLSRLHLTESGFLDEYERIKNRYSIPDGLIQLELTETVVYENFELIYNAVDRVHKLGFVMALDDFGSGYSSLNLLKDIPVDILKLDRGFFDEERGSRNRGEHIIEGIISLARKLDMVIVAEGVESMAQLAFLKQVQCDMVQGYIYSKPVSIEEFEELTFAKKA